MPNFQGCCNHDHSCEEFNCEASFSLEQHVDKSNIRCLNEEQIGSCKNVIRPWSERLMPVSTSLRSNEEDPELLLHIPFNGLVKLKALCIIGGPNGSAPSNMRVFINRDDLDFTSVSTLQPVQQWDLQEDVRGVIEYPTIVTKFNGVHSLDIHFAQNFGASCMEVTFVGLKGEFSEAKRQAVEAVYEVRPVGKGTEVPGIAGGSHWGVGQ